MSLPEFPDDETGKRHEQHHRDGLEERRIQPIEIVAHVEQRLKPQEQHRQQHKPDQVEARVPATKASPVQQGGQRADNHECQHEIQVEQKTPPEHVRDIPPHRHPDGEGRNAEQAPDGQGDRLQSLGILVEQHGLGDRQRDATGNPLHNASGNELRERLAITAQIRRHAVHHKGPDQQAVIADTSREVSRKGKAQGQPDHEVGLRPGEKTR